MPLLVGSHHPYDLPHVVGAVERVTDVNTPERVREFPVEQSRRRLYLRFEIGAHFAKLAHGLRRRKFGRNCPDQSTLPHHCQAQTEGRHCMESEQKRRQDRHPAAWHGTKRCVDFAETDSNGSSGACFGMLECLPLIVPVCDFGADEMIENFGN